MCFTEKNTLQYFADDPAMKFDEKYKTLSEKEKKKYDKAFLNEDKDLTEGASNVSVFWFLDKLLHSFIY